MTKLSLSKDKIRILLLEGIHRSAAATLADRGYTNVVQVPKGLDDEELIERLQGVHILGIRSRTQVRAGSLENADRLIALGCFGIGTDQVDLPAARRRGIPVFNAPFSNTRSVAELVMGEIVMLMRGVFAKSQAAHRGEWMKSATNSFEVRGKTLGIIGYGNIGAQLGILAETGFGMRVVYYDHTDKLPIGNAQPAPSLEALLRESDVVSLHVPETEETAGLIGPDQIRGMRRGAFLVNASRGNVVDLDALAEALRDEHLLGAAIDVFPVEPANAAETFRSPLCGHSNAILTPHIGGSTGEAQERIGVEVARKLADYSDVGSTVGAMNFPQVQLPLRAVGHRFLHVHRNAPGVLKRIIDVFSRREGNIAAQYLQTDPEIGYAVMDVEGELDTAEVLSELRSIEGTIRARFLR